MRFSLSNRVSPSRTMRPRSGCSIPAMHLRVMLLPLPEGPSRPSTPPSDSNRTWRKKPPRSFSMSTRRLTGAPPFRCAFPSD